ncbi:MAG TPA: NADH-quinone oxidoreductase subunit A [Geobacteraceae bacterium]|nr:NADH-quinone oxidoreductase subunit A [Geobacteraceae bacterium]
MTENYLLDYIYFIFFTVGGALAASLPLITSLLIGPRSVRKKTLAPYECGMDPYGSAWDIRFNIAYYLYALMFLAFDVEVLYLFPVAIAYNRVSGLRGVIELVIFIGILALAIVYAWVKGVFSWAKRRKSY